MRHILHRNIINFLIQGFTTRMAKKEILMLVLYISFWLPATSRPSKCPSGCTCTFQRKRPVSAYCNKMNFTVVPKKIPNTLTSLFLNHNSIKIIRNEDFYNLSLVLRLDLSYNKLNFLQSNSFIWCPELRILDLSHNELFFNSTSLPLELFRPLKFLKSLSLQGNFYPFVDYPEYFLGKLHDLEILRIDGVPVQFGADFSNLKNLTEIYLNGNDGYCIMGNVSQETFRALSFTQLNTLDISHCHIETISQNAFSMLSQLSTLILRNFKSGMSNLQNAIIGLDKTNITELYISRINRKPIPVTLSKELQPLTDTAIRKLYITDSHLYEIRPEFIEMLPKTILELSFCDNIISRANFLEKIYLLRNLKKVDLSYQRQYTSTDHKINPDFRKVQSDAIQLPPHLEVLLGSHLKLGYYLVQGTIFKPNILRFLDLSSNELRVIGGEWIGLHRLKVLNLSNNELELIDHRFFRDMYNLTHLFLGGNKIRDSLIPRFGYQTFESQISLRQLDLSDNGIRRLPPRIFSNLHKLMFLHLNNNSLTELDFLKISLARLTYLDLSFNQISEIDDKTKQTIDKINHEGNVTVSLHGNPLKCSCDQLATLNWFITTNVTFKDLASLTCESQNGSTVIMANILRDMEQVTTECWSNAIIISCTITFVVLCLVLTIIVLLYYKRWQILYMYYVGKRHINPYGYEELDKTYNAYLSYSDTARPVVSALVNSLEQEGYTLFVPQVDIKPGEREYAAISRAIQNSSCLIAFLTSEYIETATNLFEFNLAVFDGIRRRQQMIIPILLDSILYTSLDKELITFFKENPWYSFQNQKDLIDFIKSRMIQ